MNGPDLLLCVRTHLFKRLVIHNRVVLDSARWSHGPVPTHDLAPFDLLRLILTNEFDVAIGILDYRELIILDLLENPAKLLLRLFDIPQVLDRSIIVDLGFLRPILPRM